MGKKDGKKNDGAHLSPRPPVTLAECFCLFARKRNSSASLDYLPIYGNK